MVTVFQFHRKQPGTVGHMFHRMGCRIPMVKVTYHTDSLGMRGVADEVDGPQRFLVNGFHKPTHQRAVIETIDNLTAALLVFPIVKSNNNNMFYLTIDAFYVLRKTVGLQTNWGLQVPILRGFKSQ